MNKTQKILACVGNIKYKSISAVVVCTEQLVYSVLNSKSVRGAVYKPRHKKTHLKTKIEKIEKLKLEKGMCVLIFGSDLLWEVKLVGRQFICLKNGFDTKNLTNDKISKIVSS